MFQAEADYIYQAGCITLRIVRGRFVPDRVADQAVLSHLLRGRCSFTEAEYDEVLRVVSQPPWELGLRVIEND